MNMGMFILYNGVKGETQGFDFILLWNKET